MRCVPTSLITNPVHSDSLAENNNVTEFKHIVNPLITIKDNQNIGRDSTALKILAFKARKMFPCKIDRRPNFLLESYTKTV